jgi:hypothetical protein
MSRTIKDVISDWRRGGGNDDGELESRVNYFIATEVTPQLRTLTEAERQVVEAAVALVPLVGEVKIVVESESDYAHAALALHDAVARLETLRATSAAKAGDAK